MNVSSTCYLYDFLFFLLLLLVTYFVLFEPRRLVSFSSLHSFAYESGYALSRSYGRRVFKIYTVQCYPSPFTIIDLLWIAYSLPYVSRSIFRLPSFSDDKRLVKRCNFDQLRNCVGTVDFYQVDDLYCYYKQADFLKPWKYMWSILVLLHICVWYRVSSLLWFTDMNNRCACSNFRELVLFRRCFRGISFFSFFPFFYLFFAHAANKVPKCRSCELRSAVRPQLR